MTVLEWVACAARTGLLLNELPDLSPTQPLKRTIGQPESLTVDVLTATLPKEWRRATRPGATFLVALAAGMPVYGCMPMTRASRWSAAADTAGKLTLGCVTVEGYLDRRYVGTVTYHQVGQNLIVADLIARFVVPDGIPLRVVVHGGAGPLRDIAYLDSDDRTVLSALDDLAGLDGGPLWTVEWEASLIGGRQAYTPVLHVGTIGNDPRTKGLQPVVFEVPAGSAAAELLESYESGRGANVVTATGQKAGDSRPQVTRSTLTDPDLPAYELRDAVTSVSGDPDDVVTTAELTSHATGALSLTLGGGNTISITSDVLSAPTLGDGTEGTWQAGDVVTVAVTTPDGAAPGAYSDTLQCIGWEWDTAADPETVTPILYVPTADDL